MQNAFVVAGTHSGAGKTTLTLALQAALHQRGLKVQGAKVGPDFIDPSQHAVITSRPSYNLDAWMGGVEGMHRVYNRMLQGQPFDVLVAEGVMGLFDGAEGLGGPGSTAHCAQSLNLPIVLVLDVRGMGQSAAAIAKGFLSTKTKLGALPFAGIICTYVGSQSHKSLLEEAFIEIFAEDADLATIPILGYVPREQKFALPSRHLGLFMGEESPWTAQKIAELGAFAEEFIDIDSLLMRTQKAHPKEITFPQKPATTRIGIAYDAAFAFLYADMVAVLNEMGAECVFFSPLSDTHVPHGCSALYFPGGYPELYAERLCANTSMLQSVRDFAKQKKRIYAECGGFMYLMKSIEYNDATYPFCGLLPLSAHVAKEKAALGYRGVRLCEQEQIHARGHEFHYGRVYEAKENWGLPSLWHVTDRKGKDLSSTEASGLMHENIFASWIHLYPEGARSLLAHIFNL